MACCTGDHCPISGHHHQKAPAHKMDCGHEMGSLMSCTMSCCQTSDRPMVASFLFVLPSLSFSSVPATVTRVAETPHLIALPGSFVPLSPPPRFAAAVL